jgi:hypothetical protein
MSDTTGPHLAPVPDLPPAVERDRVPPKRKTKVKKLRLLAILVPLAALAIVSTIFGMMMAVASDLPSLEQLPQVAKRKNSVLTDINGQRLTTLTSNQGRIIVSDDQISSYAKLAVISVEDQRFYQNSGVDLRGGAGLPLDAQVVQGAHPHRVPQHGVLRQRRLRDRGGRAHVLRRRPQPQGLRQGQQPDVRPAADARRGRAAGGDHRVAERV